MALRALFVGVNKHADHRINELACATKDAIALWALFKDSVDGIVDRRLLDEQATAATLRQALEDSLGAATAEDTVVVFFAGHGTPTHELVPYDANIDEIGETTIPMTELSRRLIETAARASVVMLDCCFSGAAPARVLEGLPIARSGVGITVTDLGGDGRVVLAAAKDNEEALELGQHGLFTAAILQALKEGANWLDIGVLMAEVTKQVRAEASRIGREQTPVWSGLIEGGLDLPPLQPGALYGAEFPDTNGILIGPALDELAAFGMPRSVLDAWRTRFSELNTLQLSAVNDYRVLDDQSLLVVAPTTSGKTFVGELAAADAIIGGRKAVFLLPFKALANEKYEEFQELYGERLGMRILRCTGDYTDQTESFGRGQYDVAVLTYEMFLGLSLAMPNSLAKIGLIVLDEAQFVTDPNRGIGVELLLTNLIAARERGVQPQIVALSAVIGDVNHFDQWLGCQTLYTTKRPVPLVEGVLDRNGTYQYLTPEGEERTEQLLDARQVIQRKDKAEAQDVIVPLAKKLVAAGEQILVFRNTRGSASGCAKYLSRELGLAAAEELLRELPRQDPSTTSRSLREALGGGTAFHTSDLNREERVLVERGFRDPYGPVRVLAATSTVAAGVNTPASTVIIAETVFYGRPPQDYTVAEYKNMAGRAGRLGLSEMGRSVLLANDSVQRSVLFDRYVRGNPEPIRSSFDPKDLDTWILRLLAQVDEIPRDAVVSLLANTYAGYLEGRKSREWLERTREALEDVLGQMVELGLLEEEMGLVRLSLLGKACGRSHLKLRSAMRLIDLLRRAPDGSLTSERLLGFIHALPEFDDAFTPMFRKGRRESAWQEQVASHYGRDVAAALQKGAATPMDYYARCKRAAVLCAWTRGAPIEEIERSFTVNPFYSLGAGDIRGFADIARFHLQAAFEIADVLLLGDGPSGKDVEQLLAQLEVGLPAEALGLLELPGSLPRGTYLALHRAGHRRPDEVLALPETDLAALVGDAAVQSLVLLAATASR